MFIGSRIGRRRFLKQSIALGAPGGLLTGCGAGRPPAAKSPDAEPLLRAIASYRSNPDVGYFFAFDGPAFYRNLEPDLKAVSDAGFNAVYLLYHPFQSEDGRPTPWQDHIPAGDPDFALIPPPGPDQPALEEQTFRRILAVCRKNGLKAMFNIGWPSPQKWFRENGNAISRLPDGSPQYDEIFERSFRKQILTPCFRSERFRSHARRILSEWLRQYRGSPDFEAVLTRVQIANRFEIRLSPSGFPIFHLHQDTIDRNWCHCSTCQTAFRAYIERRYASVSKLNQEFNTRFGGFNEISIPVSPHVPDPGRFKAIDVARAPEKKRLWYEAARFWSESIAGWRTGIVSAVREFYPDAQVLMISKYPLGAFLTDYPLIARDGKLFLMDSYPMETGLNWNLLRYFFDIETYHSAAAQNGQALVAHLQGFDNHLPNHVTRAPWPEEFRQQHIGLIARRVGATVTFAFDHAVQLSPTGKKSEYVPNAMELVRQWHGSLPAIERAYEGASPYRGAVTVRYNPLENCNPKGAQAAFDRYKYWKERGVPVRIQWDETKPGETVPASFEFLIEGEGARGADLVVCEKDGAYLVSLTGLRDLKQNIRLRVRLNGESMDRWQADSVFGPPVQGGRSGGDLVCSTALEPMASAVLRLTKKNG